MKRDTFDAHLAGLMRENGMRVTPARLGLLRALERERLPVRVKDLTHKLGPRTDTVTVYRNVEAFVRAGLVERLDFGEDVASYEFRHPGEDDHHHVTCVSCKKRANVHACVPEIVSRAAREAKGFVSIDRHSLEFFGVCVDCAKRKKSNRKR